MGLNNKLFFFLIIVLLVPLSKPYYNVLDGFLNEDYQTVFPLQLTFGGDNEKDIYSGKNRKKITTFANRSLEDHMNSVSFNLGNFKDHGELILDVEINKQLISPGFSQSVFSRETGEIKIPTNLQNKNHCNYHGVVRNQLNSFVAINTCNGIRGYIELDDLQYIIEPISNNYSKEGHVIYHPSDHVMFEPEMRQKLNKTCHVKDDTKKISLDSITSNTRIKRDSDEGNPYFIEMLMVMDEYVYKRFDTTQERQDHVLEMINVADGYYKKLNMRVVLSHIEYWKENRVELDTNPDNDLNAFVEYRYNRIRESVQSAWHRTDIAHLLVGRDIQGTSIGYAQVSAMCTDRGGGINQDLSSPLTVANILAHETGHNLGMLHDDDGCSCDADADCIMAPRAGYRQKKQWSPCSVEYLRQGLRMGLLNCLMNVPEAGSLVGPVKCGNQIVEMGEECDCGSVDDCTSRCCNPATCQLLPDAKCDSGTCCSECNFVESHIECRGTDGNDCEFPEYCTGTSAYCPANLYKENGSPCQNNTQLCSEGVCMTHDLQCQIIWGESARRAVDTCYTAVNKLGNDNGNCGMNEDGSFKPCDKKNALCGKLNCHSGEQFPVLRGLVNRYVYGNRVSTVAEVCKTVQSEQAGESDIKDIACVRPGTACGENMLCDGGQCKAMESLTCSARCNGNGMCNNIKQCHCDDGWEGEFCDNKNTRSSSGSENVSPEISSADAKVSQKCNILSAIFYLMYLFGAI